MEVIEVLRAYETLKKHELNLPTIITDENTDSQHVLKTGNLRESQHVSKNPREEDNNHLTEEIGKNGVLQNSLLIGNIDKQKRFLYEEHIISRPQSVGKGSTSDKGDGEDEKITQDNELPVDLKNAMMMELIDIKEMTDELYGPGIFDQAVSEDFSSLIKKVRIQLIQQKVADEGEQEYDKKKPTALNMKKQQVNSGNMQNQEENIATKRLCREWREEN